MRYWCYRCNVSHEPLCPCTVSVTETGKSVTAVRDDESTVEVVNTTVAAFGFFIIFVAAAAGIWTSTDGVSVSVKLAVIGGVLVLSTYLHTAARGVRRWWSSR